MKSLTYLLIASLLTICHFAFGQWTIQTSGTTENLDGLDFINAQVGIASGYHGTILKTTDGGDNWNSVMSPSNNIQWDVTFVTDSIVYITGQLGTLLYSNDQGDSWVQQNIGGTSDYIKAVDFLDVNRGYAAGFDGVLYQTSDGGNNWIDISFNNVDDYTDVYFFDEMNGLVVGLFGLMKKTTDGGITWTSLNVTSSHITEIFFINDTVGWICGDLGAVYITTDAGCTWTKQTTNTIKFIQDIHFIDQDNGWAVGRAGLMMQTIDGGNTWNYVFNPDPDHLLKVDFVGSDLGWAVGSNGTIIKYNAPETSPTDEIVADNPVSIFPNPVISSAIITIDESVKDVELSLYNIEGRNLSRSHLSKIGEGKFEFRRMELSSGTYFIKAIIDGQTVFKKMSVLK